MLPHNTPGKDPSRKYVVPVPPALASTSFSAFPTGPLYGHSHEPYKF